MEGLKIMTTVADFIQVKKIDADNHLDLGMRYSSYAVWSGFYLPDFPVDGICTDKNLQNDIRTLTHIRAGMEKDVLGMFSLAVMESIADNISELKAIIDIDLIKAVDTPERFVSLVTKTIEKYQDNLKITPVLGINSDEKQFNFFHAAESLLGSGFFEGVDIFGKRLIKKPRDLVEFAAGVKAHGLKVYLHAGEITNTEDFLVAAEAFKPDFIIKGHSKLTKKCQELLAKEKITVIYNPEPSLSLDELAAEIKELLDSGIKARLGSGCLLLYNKSLSEFAASLCNTGLLSLEESLKLIEV